MFTSASEPTQPSSKRKTETMDNINIFEYATRTNLRYPSTRGELSTEMLWEVPLLAKEPEKDKFSLGEIAKACSKALRQVAEEESFVAMEQTAEHTRLEMRLAVVKRVIEVKVEEQKLAATRLENKAKKVQLLAILAEKQASKLSQLSEKALKEQILALEV